MCVFVIPLRAMDTYHVFSWTRTSCVIHVTIRYGFSLISLNTVVLIAVERCVAVVLPAKFATFASSRNIKIHIALVWLVSLAELIYMFEFVTVIMEITKLVKRNICSDH